MVRWFNILIQCESADHRLTIPTSYLFPFLLIVNSDPNRLKWIDMNTIVRCITYIKLNKFTIRNANSPPLQCCLRLVFYCSYLDVGKTADTQKGRPRSHFSESILIVSKGRFAFFGLQP